MTETYNLSGIPKCLQEKYDIGDSVKATPHFVSKGTFISAIDKFFVDKGNGKTIELTVMELGEDFKANQL